MKITEDQIQVKETKETKNNFQDKNKKNRIAKSQAASGRRYMLDVF